MTIIIILFGIEKINQRQRNKCETRHLIKSFSMNQLIKVNFHFFQCPDIFSIFKQVNEKGRGSVRERERERKMIFLVHTFR